MIVAHVQFLTGGTAPDKMAELFEGTAHKYTTMKGLMRKYYMLSEDASMAGGVYLWETKADAEAVYGDEWRAYIKERYGTEPVVTYFECPVVVDNVTEEIITRTAVKQVA